VFGLFHDFLIVVGLFLAPFPCQHFRDKGEYARADLHLVQGLLSPYFVKDLVKKRKDRIVDPGLKEWPVAVPDARQDQKHRWEIAKSISLPALDKFTTYGWLDQNRENSAAREFAEKLSIKAVSVHDKVSTLSGGNKQKVIVAKLLTADMKVIILDEPTKGVDVGAKTAIYTIMNDLVKAGYGIIMVSSELPEVLGMSDRVVVMRDGRVTAFMDTKNATQEKILQAAMQRE
jgi:rhamnose transport system ATP-binding protein